jgi:general secretion pathway protein D
MFRSAGATLVLAMCLTAAAQTAPSPSESTPSGSQTAPAGAQTSRSANIDGLGGEPETQASKHHPSKLDRTKAANLFVEGAKDLQQNKVRAAMDSFTRAAELDPDEKKYEMADQIARGHLVEELIQQADKDKILGHFASARQEIAQAYSVDPASPVVAQHMTELASASVAGEPAIREEETEGGAPPIELRPKAGTQSLHLRTSKRSLIQQVVQAYGLQATLDDSVDGQTVRYDVDDASWPSAQRALELATGTFLTPLDPVRVLVAKDTHLNHDKLDRLAVETVYLPGLAPEEVTDLATTAKNVFALRSAVASSSTGTLTLRGRPAELNALNETLKTLLEGRSEVQLDVRMLEVDRTKAVNLGVILPNQTTVFNVYSEARNVLNSNGSLVQQIISSGLASPGDWEAILAILIASGQLSNTVLTSPFGVIGGGLTMTGIAYQGGSLNMQLNSSDVRSLDQLQLRVLDHEEATIKAGERYPIETSSYSSLGSTSSLNIPGLSTAGLSSTLSSLGITASQLQAASQLTIPQVEYQDIGLSLHVTPAIEGTDRVSMKFDLQLSSLAGQTINSLPILNNRQYTAITSVALGESALLVSSVTRQESDAITGVPGLSELPGFQNTTNKNSNLDVGELAIVITPHLVRTARNGAKEKMILLPVGQTTTP